VIPLCRSLGIGIVAYSPLGRGFLAGAATHLAPSDFRRRYPRWQGGALVKNLSLLSRLSEIAAARSCTLAQLALAWLLHQGRDIVPIPGTSSTARLEENVAAAAVRLSVDELEMIERAMPAEAVEGERYDPDGAKLLDA
jgi:aryl-alcohol dehydrogenase-like predicted oxidoreductase